MVLKKKVANTINAVYPSIVTYIILSKFYIRWNLLDNNLELGKPFANQSGGFWPNRLLIEGIEIERQSKVKV